MEENKLQQAFLAIKSGEVAVFPTDTVYGIGCDPFNEDAIEKLYEIKRRSEDKSIPVLVSSIQKAEELGEITEGCRKLLDEHWPGALTVAVKQRAAFPKNLSNSGSVALRMPDHPIALQLIKAAGGAIATTSANFSGDPPTTTYDEAHKIFGDQSIVVDGGETSGVASTVVDCVSDTMQVLREGPVKL